MFLIDTSAIIALYNETLIMCRLSIIAMTCYTANCMHTVPTVPNCAF